VPRDRNSSFTPQSFPKGSQRLDGRDEIIINMDAGRMTLREAPHHLGLAIGTVLCHEATSKITEQVPRR
jgi:transposase-like protein